MANPEPYERPPTDSASSRSRLARPRRDARDIGESTTHPGSPVLVQVVAIAGILGIAAALGAALSAADVAGWLIGLVIGTVSLALGAAVRHTSR